MAPEDDPGRPDPTGPGHAPGPDAAPPATPAAGDQEASTDGRSAPAREGEPGSASSPLDVGGGGPVTLQDRMTHGGQGSPDTNQGKTEPIPPTPAAPDPAAELPAPSLGDMNVGGADPQSPSHPAARPRDLPEAGRVEGQGAPADDPVAPDSSAGLVAAGGGTARRAPGSLGVSPEQQDTDVQAGAVHMQPGGEPGAAAPPAEPGNAHEVPVPHELPAPGTSQQAPIVQGARTPASD